MSGTFFRTLSPILILLLDEIIVCPTILCGFHFQSMDPHLLKPIKE